MILLSRKWFLIWKKFYNLVFILSVVKYFRIFRPTTVPMMSPAIMFCIGHDVTCTKTNGTPQMSLPFFKYSLVKIELYNERMSRNRPFFCNIWRSPWRSLLNSGQELHDLILTLQGYHWGLLEPREKSQSARDKSGEKGGIELSFQHTCLNSRSTIVASGGIIVVELEVPVPGLVIPGTPLAWLGRQIQST